LKNALEILPQGVYENLRQSKEQINRYYDKHNKVQNEPFVVGDKVLMINKRVPAHSTRVLTRQNYTGPYLIASKIQRDDQIGPAYKSIEMKTGNSLKYLVTPSRILNNEKRPQFEVVNPPLQQRNRDQLTSDGKPTDGQIDSHVNKQPEPGDASGFEPAIRISRQRMKRGKQEYLVLFKDGSQYWCDTVTQRLLDNFRMCQEKLRDKRRSRRTQRK